MHILEVIRRPLVTEKNSLLQEKNKYAFEVRKTASKRQIKEAVEAAFKVKVSGVNVLTVQGKAKRMGRRITVSPTWKKAVVTLEPGQKIQIFEGV
jgi:large subunit ribosomal protein L23